MQNKKKDKKKKSSKKAKAPDPFAGLDEVDRALAELKLRYDELAACTAGLMSHQDMVKRPLKQARQRPPTSLERHEVA